MSTRKKKPAPSTENVTTLDQLERMVRWSDSFTLAFVKCNAPLQCREHIAQLKERLDGKRFLEIWLDKPIVSLLDTITAHWDVGNPPDAVCVFGLEASINIDREASQVLGRLNHDRDLLRRGVPCSLLIWLPDFALDCLVRGAPDFWAWRSGVYEFSTDIALWASDSLSALEVDTSDLSSLSLAEKEKEKVHFEALLRSAQSLPQPGKREQQIIAGLLYKLGVLHLSLGEFSSAQSCIKEALVISKKFHRETGIAYCLHILGVLQQLAGKTSTAIEFYQQSLELKRKLDLKKGVALTLRHLGNLKQVQGELEEAQLLYQESLQIEQLEQNAKGIGQTLHSLGVLKHRQGQLDEALDFYEKGLEIFKREGDQRSIAFAILQLARARRDQGDIKDAIQLGLQSLNTFNDLGEKFGVAASSNNLGQSLHKAGRMQDALSCYVAAWRLFRELQVEDEKISRKNILIVRRGVGDEQFEAWLQEDFGKREAKEIVATLDKEMEEDDETKVLKPKSHSNDN